MARYIVRRLMTMLLTMIIVSILVFAIVEIAPGNVARNILGAYATPEQELSMANQLGLTRPVVIRYISWLLGSDWQASPKIGLPLTETVSQQGNDPYLAAQGPVNVGCAYVAASGGTDIDTQGFAQKETGRDGA